MATVHPSRMGLVPKPTHSLPPRPPPQSSTSASTSTSTSKDAPPIPISREEELRRKLLMRKGRAGRDDQPEEPLGRGGGDGERGMRGRELIDSDVRAVSTIGILGRAGRARDEASANRLPLPRRSRSRSKSEPEIGERPVDIRAGRSDEGSPRLRRDRRSYSPVRIVAESNAGQKQEAPRGERREEDRGEGRERRYESQRLRDDYATWKARRDGTDEREKHPERRERGMREDEARYRSGSRPNTRDNSRRPSPSYRPHDESPPPAAPPGTNNGPGRTGPPPWKNAGAGLPPFPPNRRLGPMDFEQRRMQRETMTFSIWPPSPTSPFRNSDDEEKERNRRRDKKSKKSKSRAKYSDTESSDSEYERRRRRRKEKRRKARREEESDDEREVKRRRSKSAKTRSPTRSLSPAPSGGDDQWVEKGAEVVIPSKKDLVDAGMYDSEDDDEVGPRLPVEHGGKDRFKTHYEGMLYGEAEAMAQYAADGRRIPRRGEIGLDAEKIDEFETAGYVMSGNRHKRMNAVRLRKENQVINAEEKRAILKLQREENVRKEGAIVTQFREMLEEKLREGNAK